MIINIENVHTYVIKLSIKLSNKKSNALSKFMVLCWSAFIAILGHTWPVGCGLNVPGTER